MKKVILVVDDEPLLAMDAVSFLRKQDYEAQSCQSGEECLERLAEGALPDLILMDIDLGKQRLDGTDTARRVYQAYDIPIVFRSSHSDRETIEKTEEITPYGYVGKGSGNERLLLVTLRMAFKLHSTRRELKRSEETYALAMEAANEGLWDWDVESGSVQYSPAWKRILGIESLEERYESWAERIHPEDRRKVLSSLEEHLRGDTEQWHCDHRLRAKDGTWVWVAGHGQVVGRRGDGAPLRMVGTMTDITSYKRLSNLYANSERIARFGSWVTNLENGQSWWSDEFYRICGFEPQSFTPSVEAGLEIIHPDDRQKAQEAFERVQRLGGEYHITKRIVRPSGEVRRVLSRGEIFNDQLDETRKLQGVFLDISDYLAEGCAEALEAEHRRPEQAGDASQGETFAGLLRNMFEHSPVAVWVEDVSAVMEEFDRLRETGVEDIVTYFADHPEEVERLTGLIRVEEVNEVAREMLGAKSKEELGSSLVSLTTSETLEMLKEEFIALFQGRTEVAGETRGKTADGRVIDILVMGRLPRPGDRHKVMVISTIDITERVHLQQEFGKAYAELQETVRQKEDLLREVHHRVKNNLAMITSLINLKSREIDEHSTLQEIRNQMQAVSILHEKLYRSEEMSEIELSRYLEELLESIFSNLSRIRVAVECACEPISVFPDIAVYLGLITNEVATNAIKYGFAGDGQHRFTLTVKREADNSLLIRLSNSGRPFPPDVAFPGSSSLGLQLIEALVQQLGAVLELRREPSPEFTIRLPLSN